MRIVLTSNGTKEINNTISTNPPPPTLPPLHRRNPSPLILPSHKTRNQPLLPSNTEINQTSSNIQFIELKPKKLNIPSLMEEKYTSHAYTKNDNQVTIINYNKNICKTESSKDYVLHQILSPINKRKSVSKRKQIKAENTDLLEYLSTKRDLNQNFIKKIEKSNDEKLFKLNKICQKHYHNEEVRGVMKNVICKKVRWEYVKDNDFYKRKLFSMKRVLSDYNYVYKQLRDRLDLYKKQKEDYFKLHNG